MKLAKLDAEQLEYALVQRARGFKVPEVVRLLEDEYPKVHKYEVQTYRKFFKSQEGRAELTRVAKAISEKAIEIGFAKKGDRLDLLNEMVDRLRARLRDYEAHPETVSAKEINDTNGELRQTLAALQKEMDPLADTRDAVAPAVAILQAMREAERGPPEPKLDPEEIVQ